MTVIQKRKKLIIIEKGKKHVWVSWIGLTLWNTCNILVALNSGKKERKKEKKAFSLKLFRTHATLRNILENL